MNGRVASVCEEGEERERRRSASHPRNLSSPLRNRRVGNNDSPTLESPVEGDYIGARRVAFSPRRSRAHFPLARHTFRRRRPAEKRRRRGARDLERSEGENAMNK